MRSGHFVCLRPDGIEPDATLEQAVATVAYLYATIGGMVESSGQ